MSGDRAITPEPNVSISTERAVVDASPRPMEIAATPAGDNRVRPPSAELRRDTSRVEAFSDGVYAVAITLLVLNLVVPPHPPGGLFRELVNLWPAYVSYLASFLFVGVSWVNHHGAFKRIREVDAGLLWVNLVLLLTVVPVPFPTAVLANALRDGNAADSKTAVALYGLTIALHAFGWLCFLQYLSRRTKLLRRTSDGTFIRIDVRRAPFGIVAYGAAAVVGYFVNPLIALGVFAVFPIFYGVTAEGLRSAREDDRERSEVHRASG